MSTFFYHRFCLEDEAYLVTSSWPGANSRPFRDATINSLKHKLLVYLYKRADYISYITKDPYELRRFYQYFEVVWSLQYVFKITHVFSTFIT